MKRQEFSDLCAELGLLPISPTEYAHRGIHAEWQGFGVATAWGRVRGGQEGRLVANWPGVSTRNADYLSERLTWALYRAFDV